MKICVVGTFSRDLKDEGHANICINLAEELEKNHEVFRFDAFHASNIPLWKDIHDFAPDIVHFIPGATLMSFLLLRLLKSYTGAKTVISLVNPRIHSTIWSFIVLIRPDLILHQSYQIERVAKNLRIKTKYLPNGVDTNRFIPIEPYGKLLLRKEYGINTGKYVILHVGHLTRARGILLLTELNGSTDEVLVISSSYFKIDRSILRRLTRSGCTVWRKYFNNIEQLYQLADCYVYPTAQNKSILMPLSILEAMSCNLPVVCSQLNGIEREFGYDKVRGLIYTDKNVSIKHAIEKAKVCGTPETRNAVLGLSWSNVGNSLDKIYQDLVDASQKATMDQY
jgi:glycosyltransferase involved in cell wall biosynthesis